MKWLLAKILWIPKAGAALFLCFFVWAGLQSGDQWANLGLPILSMVFFIVFIEGWQRRLLKHYVRPQSLDRPPRQSKPDPAPIVAPVTPQAPPERRFAPIPVAETQTAPVQPARAVMPDHVRQFVERGDRAISRPETSISRHQMPFSEGDVGPKRRQKPPMPQK